MGSGSLTPRICAGDLIKSVRAEKMAAWKSASGASMAAARNFGAITAAVPWFLSSVDALHRVVGPAPLQAASNLLNRASGRYVPAWNPHMPRGAAPVKPPPAPAPVAAAERIPRRVVYLPSCVTRMMGPSLADSARESVHEVTMRVMARAGYEVILPEGLGSSCCGMMFNSRGFAPAAAAKMADLEASLLKASEGGKLPIVVDTSPCLMQIKTSLSTPALRFALYEPVEFINHFLVDKLDWRHVRDSVAIHVPCSSKKMGIEAAFMNLAQRCATTVQPSGVPCCGMAGDRGMRYPELTAASLQHLSTGGCSDGYSTSRTCEMSLSNHSGVNFRGLVYLVDEATAPRAPGAAAP